MREMKENLSKWRDILRWVGWVGGLSIVKMSVSPNWSVDSTQSNLKISIGIFFETDKLVLEFMWKCKGPKIAKTTLKEKNEVGRLI